MPEPLLAESLMPDLMHLHRVLARAERRPCLVLLALCLILWLPGFFTLPPGDRDESRFAQATKQMIETGNAIQIRNGLVARNQKPIGIYWLQLPFALAARTSGVATRNPIWPYRLPSLIGGLIGVLATYRLGRALVGERAALLGAVFLAASAILTIEVHIAKTDAALLAATTVAMAVLSRAWLVPAALTLRTSLVFWAALGVGILLKGPITPMVVGLTIAWLAVWNWRAGPPRWLWALRPKAGIWLTLAIVLPWFIAIAVATHGAFYAQSVGGDLAGKLAGSDDAHGAPPGLHLLLLPVLLFAGGTAAVCALPSIWRDRRLPAIKFLIAWIIPNWLAFEAVATKLPHYTLPLYPAIALLAGRWMLERPRLQHRKFGASLAIATTGLLGLAALILPEIVLPGLHWPDLLGLPAACAAALVIMALTRTWPDPRRAVLVMLCGAPFLYAGILGLELPLLRPLWIAPQVAAQLAAHWPTGRPTDAGFGALGYAEPSLMFLCGTDTRIIASPAAAAAFVSPGSNHVVAVGDRDLAAFLAAASSPRLIGTVAGYNYSRGRRLTLSLYAADYRMK